MTQQECILTALFHCGSNDLLLLEDINYDLDVILEELVDNNDLSINSLFGEVFRTGARELQEQFEMQKERIRENILYEIEEFKNYGNTIEDELLNDDKYMSLVNDLELLNNEELNPYEDLDYFCNCLDTHVFMKHIDFYRRWLSSEVDNIEYKMGWEFKSA